MSRVRGCFYPELAEASLNLHCAVRLIRSFGWPQSWRTIARSADASCLALHGLRASPVRRDLCACPGPAADSALSRSATLLNRSQRPAIELDNGSLSLDNDQLVTFGVAKPDQRGNGFAKAAHLRVNIDACPVLQVRMDSITTP